MIGYLKGIILACRNQEIWINVSGVGYRVRTAWNEVNKPGDDIEVFVHTAVREDAITLYGFHTREEMELFELLISVSGIGPKTGMDIVRSSSKDQIESAIQRADVSFFASIKGIGKKSAQRIIIDLKNKIGSLQEIDLTETEENDAVFMALKQFGFTTNDIQKVMRDIDRTASEETQIKKGLQLLGKTTTR